MIGEHSHWLALVLTISSLRCGIDLTADSQYPSGNPTFRDNRALVKQES
jgi:hypothetical protein